MLSAVTPTQPHEYTEMSRLADYFVVVGYDHEKESESPAEIASDIASERGDSSFPSFGRVFSRLSLRDVAT